MVPSKRETPEKVGEYEEIEMIYSLAKTRRRAQPRCKPSVPADEERSLRKTWEGFFAVVFAGSRRPLLLTPSSLRRAQISIRGAEQTNSEVLNKTGSLSGCG